MRRYDIMVSFEDGEVELIHSENDLQKAIAYALECRTNKQMFNTPVSTTWVQDSEDSDKVVWE